MDYTQSTPIYKIKKGLRYLRLYGLGRTLAKIEAQYHMKRTYAEAPPIQPTSVPATAHVGLLGCGKFAYSEISHYLKTNYGNVIAGVMDIDQDKAISLQQKYKAGYYTTDAMQVINDPRINLFYIASNHASHAEYAIEALKINKSVHIEKPHAVNMSQLVRLCEAMRTSTGRVRLGFNRPNSTLGQMVIKHLNKETGPLMLNWFVAGHEIEADHWYFAEEEGGRVLGNLCHWTDLVLQMIPKEKRFPVTIVPVRSDRSDCDISVNYIFGDGSIGIITFSAKGHTFEGVRETLNGHRGNTLVSLKDFKEARIDIVENVITKTLWRRDHGHSKAVTNSYKMLKDVTLGESVDYVWDTGYLVLKTKEALEKFEKITIQGYETSFAEEKNKLNL